MHQSTASLPAASTSTIALGPKVDAGEFHIYVLVDPDTGAMSFQPFIPHGQSRTFVAELSAPDTDAYKDIAASLDGVEWFSLSEGATINAEKEGITCDIFDFGKRSVTVKIVNGNKAVETITLGLTLAIVDNEGKRRPGPDPQIVLPPEKFQPSSGAVPPGSGV